MTSLWISTSIANLKKGRFLWRVWCRKNMFVLLFVFGALSCLLLCLQEMNIFFCISLLLNEAELFRICAWSVTFISWSRAHEYYLDMCGSRKYMSTKYLASSIAFWKLKLSACTAAFSNSRVKTFVRFFVQALLIWSCITMRKMHFHCFFCKR